MYPNGLLKQSNYLVIYSLKLYPAKYIVYLKQIKQAIYESGTNITGTGRISHGC